jgi:hypothetical protein
MIGRGEKTQAEERHYRIELQALMDVYEGNPYDESRWNITEAYHYRVGWIRAQDQIRIEGKGSLTKEAAHEN